MHVCVCVIERRNSFMRGRARDAGAKGFDIRKARRWKNGWRIGREGEGSRLVMDSRV